MLVVDTVRCITTPPPSFVTYFKSSLADTFRVALRAFETLTPEAAVTFREAGRIFPEGEPPRSVDARTPFLATLGDAALRMLSDLATAFRTSAEPTLVERLAQLVLDLDMPLAPIDGHSVVPAVFSRLAARDERSLSAADRDFLRVFAFADEVSAGGFIQYFLTAASRDGPGVVRLLAAMGCPDGAALLARALEATGELPQAPVERHRSCTTLGASTRQVLATLDEQFRASVREPLTATLARFAEEHRDDLSLSSDRDP
jgi:hypothetical protein